MKKSELSVVIFMLGFCAFFFYETLQLPPAAQSYPKFVIGLLAVLTLMQLVKMACSCHGHFTVINDLPEVWTHFLPRQFFTFLAASILRRRPLVRLGSFVLMVLIGFYPAAILYLVFMMHFFHIEKKYMAITVVVLMVLIYIVFSEFLAVPLPAGLLLDELL